MADKEKVIKGLTACADHTGKACRHCVYDFGKLDCMATLAEDALELLKEQPEIVRCKDCKYASIYGQTNIFGKPLCDCEHPDTHRCEYNCRSHHLDWFCADGERR